MKNFVMIQEEVRWGMRGYLSDGKWFPAVSSLLEILCPMPQGWIDQEDLDLGSVLHRTLFLLSNNDEAPTAGMYPRADAAVHWLRENDLRVVEAETPRATPLGWAGRPDALLQRGRSQGRIVCDFKFSEVLIPRYEVQLELYRRLYTPLPQMLLLQITKKGKVNPRWLKPNPAHYAGGLNALNLLRWRMLYGGTGNRGKP